MEIKIDSSPWTELHSSPRSPRQVLPSVSNPFSAAHASVDITRESTWPKELVLLNDGMRVSSLQAHFATGVDVGIESTLSSVGRHGTDMRWFGWIIWLPHQYNRATTLDHTWIATDVPEPNRMANCKQCQSSVQLPAHVRPRRLHHAPRRSQIRTASQEDRR